MWSSSTVIVHLTVSCLWIREGWLCKTVPRYGTLELGRVSRLRDSLTTIEAERAQACICSLPTMILLDWMPHPPHLSVSFIYFFLMGSHLLMEIRPMLRPKLRPSCPLHTPLNRKKHTQAKRQRRVSVKISFWTHLFLLLNSSAVPVLRLKTTSHHTVCLPNLLC